jgi:hypothetical protein
MSARFKPKEVIVVNGVQKTRCSRCKYLLPFDNFHKDKSSSLGIKPYCKACGRTRQKRLRFKHRQYNSGVIGLYTYTCALKSCGCTFVTKRVDKSFCSNKCKNRDWYERNEQSESAKQNGKKFAHLNITRRKSRLLTALQVEEIRQLLKEKKLTQIEISKKYKVSNTIISDINCNRRTYKLKTGENNEQN